MGDQIQLGELMHILMDSFTQLGHTDQLSDLVGVQVVQTLPGEGFLFNLLDDLLGYLSELTQG